MNISIALVFRSRVTTSVAIGVVSLLTACGGGGGGGGSSAPAPVVIPTGITGFSPTNAAIGQQITLSGTNLTGVSGVSINGVPATISSATASSLVVSVPASASSGAIVATTTSGASLNVGAFIVDPTVTRFTPANAAYGQELSLIGTGLSSVVRVTINGIPANISNTSNTTLALSVPAKASTGALIATTSSGITLSLGNFIVDPFGPPITITRAGTYSGNWQSLDPAVSAVTIRTTEPVTIHNCNIQSKGELIRASVSNAAVRISNCRGVGLDPMIAGKRRGSFFSAYQIGSLTAENNYMEATDDGFQLYNNDGWTPSGPIVIRYNLAKNLEGAASDGRGGRDLSSLRFGQSNGNHFVILANLQRLRGTDISWNHIISEPGLGSIGDVINIYSSSGTATSPISIHNNYIQGGYPAVSSATSYDAGGITMDGRATDTPDTATAFVKIHNNQIIGHALTGINLVAGHDNEAYANRIVSTGQYSDGSWYIGYTGIWIKNCCYNQSPAVYFNNSARDNIVGFQFQYAYPQTPNVFSPPVIRQDYVLPDCAGGESGPNSLCTNNVSIPGAITSSTEANELEIWRQKRITNNIIVGPVS